ncbi:MAG TPA: hypothetical protein DDW52_07820 [Planctomycetaceae bacterium]|nr:hypothetical protein [Planctomycetaceae bacterium]
MMIASATSRLLAVCGLVVVFTGCDAGVQRHAVSGTLTIDGEPVDDVTIVFTPVGEGLSGAAEVFEGEFACGEVGGPSKGMHNIRISPNEAEMEEVEEDLGELKAPRKPKVPLKYQRLGGLQVEITGEEGQVLNLQLER